MADQLMGLLNSGSDVSYRGGLLPLLRRVLPDIGGDDISEFEGPLELATPALAYDPMRNMALTGAMLRGHIPVDEGLLTQTMVDAPLVGGLLFGAVPRGAVLGAFSGRGVSGMNDLPQYRTSDGYTFYQQKDGTLTDNADPEMSDMVFNSLDDLANDFGEMPLPVGKNEVAEKAATEFVEDFASFMDPSPEKLPDDVKIQRALNTQQRKKDIDLAANKSPTAALPGLLDDTASRMQRARDMGFDVDAYHGTRGDFIQFEKGDLGFHFGSPEQATNRLRQTEKVFGSEGANIIPAKINVNKSLELPDLGQWNDPAVVAAGIIERGGAFGRKYGDELQEIQQEADSLKRQFEDQDAWVESMEAADLLDEIQGIIKRDGYDSVKYLNEMENKMGDRGGFTIEGQKKYNALNKEFHELNKKIAQRKPEQPTAPALGASEAEVQRWLNRSQSQGQPTAAESKRLEEIARAKEELEKTGTHSPYSYIVFDPKNIRSRFAKFDPAKADSADLLAASPVTAALPGLLEQQYMDESERLLRDSQGLLGATQRRQNQLNAL